jgi:hypothetical protein
MEYRHPEVRTVLEGFVAGKEWTYRLMPVHMRPNLLSSFAATTVEAQVAWLRK